MKRTLSLLLSLLLLLPALVGCRSKGQGSATSDSSALSVSPPADVALPESGDAGPFLDPTPSESHAPDATGPLLLYTVNDTSAGKLEGLTLQNTKKVGTRPVRAVPNLGYRFVGWSDGLKSPVRKGDRVKEATVITAIFDYDRKELPILTLDTASGYDVASKETYEDATLSIMGAGAYDLAPLPIEVHGRGNNTWGGEKKPYKLKLSRKENLLGIANGRYKRYVLIANHCDQSLLRNEVGLALGRVFDRLPFVPGATQVDLYLNGRYQGVYLLAESIEAGAGRVEVDISHVEASPDTGFLFKIDSYSAQPDFTVENKKYAIQSPLSEKRSLSGAQRHLIAEYTKKCYRALKAGDSDAVSRLIDLPSLVDAYLYEEILKNLDMGWDSFYLCKARGGKLSFGPCWDFDLTFGNGDEGCEDYRGLYCAVFTREHLSNPWFVAANENEWFRAMVSARWAELYPAIDTELGDLTRAKGEGAKEAFARNFVRYPIFGQKINRETEAIRALTSHPAHTAYLADWIDKRIAWLNGVYPTKAWHCGDALS